MTNLRMRISPSGPPDTSSADVTPFSQFGGDQYQLNPTHEEFTVGAVDPDSTSNTPSSTTFYASGNPTPTHNAFGDAIDGTIHTARVIQPNQQGIPLALSGVQLPGGAAVEVTAQLNLGYSTAGGPSASSEHPNPGNPFGTIRAAGFFYSADGLVRSAQNTSGTENGGEVGPSQIYADGKSGNLFRTVSRINTATPGPVFPAWTVVYAIEYTATPQKPLTKRGAVYCNPTPGSFLTVRRVR